MHSNRRAVVVVAVAVEAVEDSVESLHQTHEM